MIEPINIDERRPIWIALSKFYLDTELEESDFRHFAITIIDSPYTIDEVKEINKYEVFPILQANLLSIAGEWAGFDEEWLVNKIVNSIAKKNLIKKIAIEGFYRVFKWMCTSYWNRLEKTHKDFVANPNSYILTCRKLMDINISPFEFSKFESKHFIELANIAREYYRLDKKNAFCSYLQDRHYWIHIWTAYFLVEYFNLTKADKNIYMDNTVNTLDFCLGVIANDQSYFESDEAKSNCREWLRKRRL